MRNTTTIILIFLGLLIPICSNAAVTSEGQETENIKLKKDEYGTVDPRTIEQALFTAQYNQETLVVAAENYTGTVQVEVDGSGGQRMVTFCVSGAGATTIDIDTLPAGTYTLKLLTSKGVYTGEFEL